MTRDPRHRVLEHRRSSTLPFEFSGDGDDANLCFVGSNGLLGVKTGTVRFTAVEGNKAAFSFSGSFTVSGACSRVRAGST